MDCFEIKFRFKSDGKYCRRAEWGKDEDDAKRTIRSIYGDTIVICGEKKPSKVVTRRYLKSF